MTLLTRGVRYYFRCTYGHRFERASPDSLQWCPKCGAVTRLYGLKDSTSYAEDPQEMESLPGEELNTPDP